MFSNLVRRPGRREDLLLREARREADEAARRAREASEEAARLTAAGRSAPGGQSFAGSTGAAQRAAAQRTADLVAESAAAAQRAAFALDLRLKLAESTSTYRPWQQVPAWALGAAGVVLAFILAFDDGADVAGWVVAALMLALATIASFRGPADLSVGTGGADGGDGEEQKPDAEKAADGQTTAGGESGTTQPNPPAAPSQPAPAKAPSAPRVSRPARVGPAPPQGLRFLATGLDYRTRRPLIPPITAEELVERLHERLAANADEVRHVTEQTHFARGVRGERERAPQRDLGDPRAVGWTYLVAEDDPGRDDIVAAVRRLAEHRGMKAPEDPLVYRPDMSWERWLTETYQAIDALERPYYVMIVGGPDRVPFHFQALLDSTAAVGRVVFDSLDDLHAYGDKVVRVETAPEPYVEPKALFFAPDAGPEDATFFSRRYLAEPLAKVAAESDIDVRSLAEDEATKANLTDALAGERFALVYTASHGVGAPDEPLEVQRRVNGGICCQPDGDDSLFTADDVPGDGAFLDGSVFFQFACYGYGTPAESDFMHWLGEPTFNSEEDFVAALPKRLLARPVGPVAFIGHVDTAWLHGFDDPDNPLIADPYHERLRPFSTAVHTVLTLDPVGLALAELNKRYDVLNGILAGELDRMNRPGLERTPEAMASLADTFVFRSDAQNYAIFGDPGVRIRLP